MSAFPLAVNLFGGTVTGMMVGDSLGAIPTTANVPATSHSATPKALPDGTPVNSTPTARQQLWMSAAMVIVAVAVLVFGDRFLKDARIV